MKKTILALAVLGTFAGVASAQSGLTLSGQVDAGVVRENGDWTMRGAASSRNNISFSGREDLGNGLAAGFYLNHRFDITSGTVNSAPTRAGATQFWRQGWVQLDSAFGDIRLGRMLGPLQDFNGRYEPWDGGDTVASVHTGGLVAGSVDSRYSDSIYYRTPSFGGFKLHAMIASSDDQGTGPVDERPAGIGGEFKSGPISAALAYDRNQQDLKTIGAYGKYDFGVAAAMFQYERADNLDGSFDDKGTRWSVGATAPLGAAILKIGYGQQNDKIVNNDKVKKFGIGAEYYLSKRTFLYSDLAKLKGDSLSDDQEKVRFDVGVSHKF